MGSGFVLLCALAKAKGHEWEIHKRELHLRFKKKTPPPLNLENPMTEARRRGKGVMKEGENGIHAHSSDDIAAHIFCHCRVGMAIARCKYVHPVVYSHLETSPELNRALCSALLEQTSRLGLQGRTLYATHKTEHLLLFLHYPSTSASKKIDKDMVLVREDHFSLPSLLVCVCVCVCATLPDTWR